MPKACAYMIVVRLSGGLGNQMFQFAAAYALSLRLGSDCKVDVSAFQPNNRRYELHCFQGAPAIAAARDLPLRLRLARRGVPHVVASKLDIAVGKMSTFQEGSPFVFDRRFPNVGDNSYLVGYFQSEKYFSSATADIRRLYTFRDPQNTANRKMLDEITSVQAASVHVRRGDYVSNPQTSRVHGTCSLDYYVTAFRFLAERLKDPCFFVFSDDLAWARTNIKPPARTIYVDHNDSGAAYEDMRLMSNCRYHIIANSSFSWWAAWLNACGDKIVIAPKRWLADATVPTDDLLPENWIAI